MTHVRIRPFKRRSLHLWHGRRQHALEGFSLSLHRPRPNNDSQQGPATHPSRRRGSTHRPVPDRKVGRRADEWPIRSPTRSPAYTHHTRHAGGSHRVLQWPGALPVETRLSQARRPVPSRLIATRALESCTQTRALQVNREAEAASSTGR